MLPEGHVLITDAKGTIVEIVAANEAGSDIEYLHGILCPGFVNAHCHLELSHLKGIIPEQTGLVDFVLSIITQRHAGEDAILESIKNAEDAMLQNGIVAVGDICNTTHSIFQKKQGRLHYHNFIEATGFVPATAAKRFEAATEILFQFKQQLTTSRLQSTINPHAPYSVSAQLFGLINNFIENELLSIHNQETPAENEFFETATGDFLRLYKQLGIDISFYKPSGKTSLQTVLPYLNNRQSLILVHDVTTAEEDIKAVQLSTGNNQLSAVFYCLCPNANKYISNSLPDVNSLVKNNCNIVLGTDSLASNHQLSIAEEMKTLQHHFPDLKLTQLLQWATINGATALNMQTALGSFEKGKRPGLVLIENTDNLQLTDTSAAKRIL
jgi:aminodeoxyfutalosine deaminase